MAKYGLLYNIGSGKSKEAKDLISYDNTSGDKIVIEVASDLGATGLDTHVLGTLSVDELALLSSGFKFVSGDTAVTAFSTGAADNDSITTKGYVDDAVAGATAAGTVTYFNATVASASGLAVGQIVGLGSGTNAPLVICDAGAEATAMAIGVIKEIDGLNIKVQVDGEVQLASGTLAGFAVGELVFVGSAGAAAEYADLGTGDWIGQAGIVTDVAGAKMLMQPKIVGQVA
jgi:hypothetical protein